MADTLVAPCRAQTPPGRCAAPSIPWGRRPRGLRSCGGDAVKAVVVALGKIGLPLATQLARAGHDVVGCDLDAVTVDLVNASQPPFPGEDGLADALVEA